MEATAIVTEALVAAGAFLIVQRPQWFDPAYEASTEEGDDIDDDQDDADDADELGDEEHEQQQDDAVGEEQAPESADS